MRILYCDDDKRQLDIFYNNFIGITDDEIDICLPEEVDKRISGDTPPDIILMDLELEKAGKSGDAEFILAHHEEVLKLYEATAQEGMKILEKV